MDTVKYWEKRHFAPPDVKILDSMRMVWEELKDKNPTCPTCRGKIRKTKEKDVRDGRVGEITCRNPRCWGAVVEGVETWDYLPDELREAMKGNHEQKVFIKCGYCEVKCMVKTNGNSVSNSCPTRIRGVSDDAYKKGEIGKEEWKREHDLAHMIERETQTKNHDRALWRLFMESSYIPKSQIRRELKQGRANKVLAKKMLEDVKKRKTFRQTA